MTIILLKHKLNYFAPSRLRVHNFLAKARRREDLLLIIFSLIISFSASAQDYYQLGVDAQKKANLDQAIIYFTKKIQQDSTFGPAYIKRGLCYQDKADFDLALADFKKALQLRPGDPAVNLSMGTAYFHLKKYPEAQEHIETALKVEPGNSLAQYDLGLTRHELKDYSGAINAFDIAIRIDPKRDRFYYSRGLSKDQLRDYQGALNDFSEAIKLKPDYEKAYYARAKEESSLHMYDAALADIDILLKMNPNNTRYYSEKANLEYQHGWLDAAMNDSKKALQLNDLYGEPYYIKAMIERDSGLIDSALADISKANNLFKGKSPLGWYESGMIKLYASDYVNAVKDFENASRISPNYLYPMVMCGYAKINLKDSAGALSCFRQATRKDPRFSRGYYFIGKVQSMNQGNQPEARKNFEKALQLDNDSQVSAYCSAFLGDSIRMENILNQRLIRFDREGLKIKKRETFADFSYCYAILKKTDKSLKFLDEALGDGYSFKSWIEDSLEFDFLRNTTEYQLLKIKYNLKK
jgi:tetratricopeptide (TPR) repeat protein